MNDILERVMVLKSTDLFKDADDDTLTRVARALRVCRMAAGEVVFRQGEFGSSLYIINKGKVKVERDGSVVVELDGREVFGELAVFDPEPRSATITCLTETLLYELSQAKVVELARHYPSFTLGAIRVLTSRLREFDKRRSHQATS